MSVILETRQLCKFYGAGENQVKAVESGGHFHSSRFRCSAALTT